MRQYDEIEALLGGLRAGTARVNSVFKVEAAVERHNLTNSVGPLTVGPESLDGLPHWNVRGWV